MKQRRQTGIWLMLAPLYIFTILFVAGPLIYMVVLSFLQRGEVWGVVNSFTLDNYKNILTPIYLQTFAESFKLAITSTVFITLLGYPFGYFMAKLPPVWKKRMMLLIDHLPRQWHAGSDSDGPGAHQFPPETAVHLPRRGGGHGVCAFAVHDSGRVFQRGKNGLEPGGSRARPWRFALPRVLYGYAEADAAGAVVRHHSHLHPLDGAVLHCRYPGRK